MFRRRPQPTPKPAAPDPTAGDAMTSDLGKLVGHIRKSGSYRGKSNRLGYGGRSQQLEDRGVPGGVIGQLARKAHAAPGQANYHGRR